MNNKETKAPQESKKPLAPEPPEIPSKEKELKPEQPEPGNEKPKEEELDKDAPKLEPIKLTKSQRRLYISRVGDIEAMKNQSVAIINDLGSDIKRTLVETFAEELGIDLSERKYGFDPQSQNFIDLNELKARAGQPRMRIPPGERPS